MRFSGGIRVMYRAGAFVWNKYRHDQGLSHTQPMTVWNNSLAARWHIWINILPCRFLCVWAELHPQWSVLCHVQQRPHCWNTQPYQVPSCHCSIHARWGYMCVSSFTQAMLVGARAIELYVCVLHTQKYRLQAQRVMHIKRRIRRLLIAFGVVT